MFKSKTNLYNQSGATLLEVILTLALVAGLSPFFYSMISDVAKDIQDVSFASGIIELGESGLNFIRLNQDKWPDAAQIKLSDAEKNDVSSEANVILIDKYKIDGASVTDMYFSYEIKDGGIRAAKIAEKIGQNAAVVSLDGVAYGSAWAISSPDLRPGDLVYKISYDFSGDDTSKYLHKTETESGLNIMQRDLNMGNFDLNNVGTVFGVSAVFDEGVASFAEIETGMSDYIYFAEGANIDGESADFKNVRVNGDITGFREIVGKTLNKNGFSSVGDIVSDSAYIYNSLSIGNDLNLKSDSGGSVYGFSDISTHYVETSFLSTEELIFFNNFGITISGELLMTNIKPVQIGSWSFPGADAPEFLHLEIGLTSLPVVPDVVEFDKIMSDDWQTAEVFQ